MNAWIQITSGRGPDECSLAVAELMKVFVKDAKKADLEVDLLDSVEGSFSGTYRSVLLSVSGLSLSGFLSQWEGVVQWIMRSPYRSNYGRKNWFVGVNVFMPPEESDDFVYRDLRFEAVRASGPGGQHVNKTSSAVRVTHLKTGLAAFAQEERSQSMNKKLAVARLSRMIQGRKEQAMDNLQQDIWLQHSSLERGNPSRVYEGLPMRLKSN
ncbi:MAG: peptide chain release factor H [Opitutaceae bacterium]